jgi:hypothetical protein
MELILFIKDKYDHFRRLWFLQWCEVQG